MKSALYGICALVFASEISLVRFLIRQQLVGKYHTRALWSYKNTIRRPCLHVLDSSEPDMERYFMMGEDMNPVSFFV